MTAKDKILAAVQEHGLESIGEREWNLLRLALPDVSETTLRKHLMQAGLAIEQPWRGIDTASLVTLEQALREFTAVYREQPQLARATVIAAKDKTRFTARNQKVAAEKRALKLEMLQWMLVWLDDPHMFADWVVLRRAVLSSETPANREKPIPR